MADETPVDRSIRLLRAVRSGGDVDAMSAEFAALDAESMTRGLRSDQARLAFWCNCYNAYSQLLLDREPELYASRWRFFRAERIAVGDEVLSLDDVEHGILRGMRSKWGLGYLPRLLPSAFEVRHRVRQPDPRIHFVLNCGAASCPPIAVYEPDRIDEQLHLATAAYLDAEVRYDPDANVVRLPQLLLWFRGDFGGRAGIRRLLSAHECLPDGVAPRFAYRPYDWSRSPATYTSFGGGP